jgi:hypothetical protein
MIIGTIFHNIAAGNLALGYFVTVIAVRRMKVNCTITRQLRVQYLDKIPPLTPTAFEGNP